MTTQKMFHLIPYATNINFVGRRWFWVGLSIAGIIATGILFFTKGLNYGIDFSGGGEVHVQLPSSWDISKVRTEMGKAGFEGLRVQQIGNPAPGAERHDFLIRAQAEEKELSHFGNRVKEILTQTTPADQVEIKRADVVGPAAGSLLKKRGLQAMFFALLIILVYVAIRFDSRYAPGAILALFHDAVICIGILTLTGHEFDLTVLAAILALVGYSNNDTIIVFDRVRETTHLHPEWSIEKAVNTSMNETLGRTIMTSFSTLIVVFALWKWGGVVLESFSFTLMIGILVGTYSSLFIASTVLISLTHYQKNKELKIRTGGANIKKKKVYTVPAEPRV